MSRELINGSDVKPTFRGPDIGEVSHPFLVRTIRGERSIERVGSGDRSGASVFRRLPTFRTGFDGMQPHQSFNAGQAAGITLLQKIVPGTPGTIGPILPQKARKDRLQQLFFADRSATARSCQPRMETAS